MCCDTVYRGLAFAEGKIFLHQADTTLVALNAKTGELVWSVKNGDPKLGQTNTNAPHVMKDKVITGISGAEFGVRCWLNAYDLKTGKHDRVVTRFDVERTSPTQVRCTFCERLISEDELVLL